jgi:predicted pyridoxine 5'-phosphate oxidase superfamily flavin-nucleotide-binding protein
LLLVLFLVAIVASVTLTGAASAQQNITEANRTIDGEVASSEIVEAEPGDEVVVESILVAGDGIENPSVERLGILENFTAFDATIINDVTRNGGDANTVTETNTNDGVVVGIEEDTGPAFGAWESGDVFRVNYSVFIQADASDGDQYVFDGNATLGNEDVSLAGPDTIEINAPDFQLANLAPAQATIAEGDGPIDISADVENVGGLDGQQDVELTVTNSTGDVVLSQTETVSRTIGENATVTFSDVAVQNLAQGDYTHEISTDQDTINGSLTVAAPADYQLSNLDPADVVVAEGSDTINISADVDNNGGVAGNQDIVLEVVNNQTGDIELTETSTSVQIDAGDSQTVEFTDVDAGSLDTDDYTHRISTEQDTINGSLAVVQPATYEVSNLDPADAVVGNNSGTISISADVDNVGGVAGEKDINLEVTDDQNNSVLTDTETNVQIAAGDNQTVDFTGVDVGSLDIGDYSHTIS